MRIPGAWSLSRAARSGLSPLFAVLLGSGGCTFLVGSQLSDKPEETTGGGGGGGGQGGAGAASTSAQVTSGPSVSSSTGGHSSTGVGGSLSVGVGTSVVSSTAAGGVMCLSGFADCDGKPQNGCEISLKTDSKHCGACSHKCPKSTKCKESNCE